MVDLWLDRLEEKELTTDEMLIKIVEYNYKAWGFPYVFADYSKSIKKWSITWRNPTDFINEKHRRKIVDGINRVKLDFIRIGTSGDPSENWEHTIKIIKGIENCNKQIVIITKHWTNLTQSQLDYLGTVNVCINTSVSALDKPHLLENCILQYNT